MKAILSIAALMFSTTVFATSPPEGFWSGTAIRGAEARTITMEVIRGEGGYRASYGIQAIGLEDIPLRGFTFDRATAVVRSDHALDAKLQNGELVGSLTPVLLHGAPVSVRLAPAEAPAPAARERPVSFSSRGCELKGTIVAPLAPGRYPAMVALHGSGPSTRWLALGRSRRFAKAGYVTLIWDKPGSGESDCDWTMTSLDEMAQDAVNALAFLRMQPEAEPDKVGLWGHSQAGWVISRAAAMTDKIAFAIVLAGGGSKPIDVEYYGYRGRLGHGGASSTAMKQAMAWVDDYFSYVRTGAAYQELSQQLRKADNRDWAKALGMTTIYPTPEQRSKWVWVATYDPGPDIRSMRMPVLLMFAEKDENSPTNKSLALWRAGLAAAGNGNVAAKVFPNADHHFLVPAHTAGWPSIADQYFETQFDWLRDLYPASEERLAEVRERGAKVMGFDLSRTTHVFSSTGSGGVLRVTSDDNDPDQVGLIREHLSIQARRFATGDFDSPATIHGDEMPGLEALRQARSNLSVKYAEIPSGAELSFSSDDRQTVSAIHSWFAAQRHDHGAHQ